MLGQNPRRIFGVLCVVVGWASGGRLGRPGHFKCLGASLRLSPFSPQSWVGVVFKHVLGVMQIRPAKLDGSVEPFKSLPFDV